MMFDIALGLVEFDISTENVYSLEFFESVSSALVKIGMKTWQ
jgi:hypothetical protein